MERESNQMQALCRSGCGFYGSPATDGLCSLCYKENLKKKQQLPTNTPASLSSLRDTTTAHPTISHLPTSPISDLPHQSSSGIEETAASQMAAASANVTAAGNMAVVAAAAVAAAAENAAAAASEAAAAAAEAAANDSDKDSDKDGKKKKNRCATCRKKVGLTGFECRCGGLFCAVHRYSDKHDCSFNYREMGAKEIRRNNPVVVGEKIQKI